MSLNATRRQPLDGLRAAAAIGVAFYHGILHFDTTLIERVLYQPILSVEGGELGTKLLLIVFNGESSIVVFFVLSGFVLQGALTRMSSRTTAATAAIFTFQRIVRIYPAVVVCLALLLALSLAAQQVGFSRFPAFSWAQAVENAVLYAPTIHGPSWSVQVEVCCIPFLLAAEFLRRRYGLLGLFCMLVYALIAIEYPVLVFRLPALWPYLFMFILGMLAASPATATMVRGLHPAAVWVAIPLFLAARHATSRAAISGLIAQGLAAALLVGCIAYRDDAVTRTLSARAMVFLGRISYSFYLLNVIALYMMWAMIETCVDEPGRHAVLWGLLSATASVALTLPAAAVSERLVERPCIWLGRMILRDRPISQARRLQGTSAEADTGAV